MLDGDEEDSSQWH